MTITKKQRVDNLKALVKLARLYLDYYKKLNNQKTKTWIHKKTETSIQQLKEIIRKINKDLHPKKVEAYCKPYPVFEGISIGELLSENSSEKADIIKAHLAEIFGQTNLNFTLFDIARFAPEQNIIHDITWLTDGVLNDYIEIGLGTKKVEFLECYLPSKIQETKNYLIPYFESRSEFAQKVKIIQQAIQLSTKENYLASNILLITVTESIVRETCKYVYQHQNTSFSKEKIDEYIYNKFNSLDTLISKGNWKNDYPIGLAEAITTYKDVSEDNINFWRDKLQRHKNANAKLQIVVSQFSDDLKIIDPNDDNLLRAKIQENVKNLERLTHDLLAEDERQIKIGISTRFNFLIRKYKDDRNLIIHGNFEAFNHKWKNYINYSALLKVFETYKSYYELYSE